MRKLAARSQLLEATTILLAAKKQEIEGIPDSAEKKKRARQIYDSSRVADWFKPVVVALREICGASDLCMYCSANEPSQVEHYRPLAVFPEHAMDYSNYLWSCDICNRSHKGNRFPPITEEGEQILNPIDDNVWEFFFLDEKFGRLIARVDPLTAQPFVRAVSTCEVVGIDREAVQMRRTKRYRCLRQTVETLLRDLNSNTVTVDVARLRVDEWRTDPFQVDVADYFLNGPGRIKPPFCELLSIVGGEPTGSGFTVYPGS